MSSPPPSGSPSEPSVAKGPRTRAKEIVLRLAGEEVKGWRRRLGVAGATPEVGRIRLVGTEMILEHDGALLRPLTVPAGIVAVATVDRGRAPADEAGDEGRFAILHRMGPSAVIPAEEGVEGWLWTSRSGSALPTVGEGVPNLALVFAQPLEADVVIEHFRAEFVGALAARSALGDPTVFGLLTRVTDADLAESAFAELGVGRPLTDREVAPAQRRHLPGDKPANPAVAQARERRPRSSIPPPGGAR